MDTIEFNDRTNYYTDKYNECIENDNIEEAKEWLEKFEFADPNPDMLQIHPKLRQGKKLIATCDPNRTPLEDEIIIVYGNYPDWHHAYPYSSKMYRHVSLFTNTKHDLVESHPCWDKLDIIYIINLQTRYDRYIELLLELVKVQAPLDKIYRHIVVNDNNEASHINTSRQHIIIQDMFKNSDNKTCLIFEDDFSFIGDINHIWNSIDLFFKSSYDYEICFLSTSKYYEKCPYDNILSHSKQACTNATGYILNKKTIEHVFQVNSEGFNLYLKNPNMGYEFCIDQYWRRLTKRYFFKKKLGFQRINFPCNSQTRLSFNLD